MLGDIITFRNVVALNVGVVERRHDGELRRPLHRRTQFSDGLLIFWAFVAARRRSSILRCLKVRWINEKKIVSERGKKKIF